MNRLLFLIGKILYELSHLSKKAISHYLNQKYQQKIKNIGESVYFNGISKILGLKYITIGHNVHIGNNAYIKGHGGLYIGNNTHISRNLTLYTVNHNYEGDYLPYDNSNIKKKVIIEDNVWIGMNVTILPGSHIKEGAIVGAGAVVAGTIEKCSIYGATKAHKIMKRDELHYENLKQNKLFSGRNGVRYEN